MFSRVHCTGLARNIQKGPPTQPVRGCSNDAHGFHWSEEIKQHSSQKHARRKYSVDVSQVSYVQQEHTRCDLFSLQSNHTGVYQKLKASRNLRQPKLPALTKLPSLYEAPLAISQAKYNDLCKLIRQKGLIREEVKQWYRDLPHEASVADKTVEAAVED